MGIHVCHTGDSASVTLPARMTLTRTGFEIQAWKKSGSHESCPPFSSLQSWYLTQTSEMFTQCVLLPQGINGLAHSKYPWVTKSALRSEEICSVYSNYLRFDWKKAEKQTQGVEWASYQWGIRARVSSMYVYMLNRISKTDTPLAMFLIFCFS